MIQMRDQPRGRRQFRRHAASSASRCWAARSRKYAGVGDIIVVSVKEAIPRGKVKKGDVHRAVDRAHRQGDRAAPTAAPSASTRNAAVLINKQDEPIGTRIFGPVARELRAKKFMKIISLAPEVL